MATETKSWTELAMAEKHDASSIHDKLNRITSLLMAWVDVTVDESKKPEMKEKFAKYFSDLMSLAKEGRI